MINTYKIILLVLLFAFPASALLMQITESNTLNDGGEPILLRYADSLVGTTDINNKIMREFAGNVSMQQGDINAFCDRAKQYITENNAEFIGNVVITQKDMTLKSPNIFYNGTSKIATARQKVYIQDKNAKLEADRGEYNTQTKIADFAGNIKITDDTVCLYADSARYYRITQNSYAFGNVKIEDDSTIVYADSLHLDRVTRNTKTSGNVIIKHKYINSFLFADSIRNLYREKYTIAGGHPVLFKIDTLKNEADSPENDSLKSELKEADSLNSQLKFDTLSISSKLMETIQIKGEERYIFTDSVEINRAELSAKAGKTIYYSSSEIIYMTGSPVVWMDSIQIIADTITIEAPNNKLRKIIADGNAFATIKNDTINLDFINQLSGGQIIVKFSEDTIRNIFCYNDAKSLLFLESEKNSEGAARTFADSIYIDFNAGEPEIFGAVGGIVGEAIPTDMLLENVKLYYLPSYKRIEMKPEKKVLVFNK